EDPAHAVGPERRPAPVAGYVAVGLGALDGLEPDDALGAVEGDGVPEGVVDGAGSGAFSYRNLDGIGWGIWLGAPYVTTMTSWSRSGSCVGSPAYGFPSRNTRMRLAPLSQYEPRHCWDAWVPQVNRTPHTSNTVPSV